MIAALVIELDGAPLTPVALFILGLSWSYQCSLMPVAPILTEEGQHVLFARPTWQRRELAKRLPLEEPWPPPAADLRKAMERYGLDKTGPPDAIPIPAQIATGVFL